MSSAFERLPLELHRAIISEYEAAVDEDNEAFYDWSLTCSFFRELLSPIVFAHIGWQRSDCSVLRCNALAGTPMAAYVKRIDIWFWHLHEHDGDCDDEDCEYSGDYRILPPGVEEALTNMSLLPNLEALHIFFEVPFDWTELFYSEMDKEPMTSKDVIDAERTQDWRAMMADVYEHIAIYAGDSVKELTINNFVMTEISTFSTPVWHRFLKQLRKFEMNIPGGDNGAGWDLAAWDKYPPLTAKFDQFFFDHLVNVENFTLHPHETGALGALAPLVLRPEHLPRVRHIDLCNVFISKDFVDLLQRRAPCLETVILRDVMANGICHGDWPIHPTWSGDVTWAHLFTSLADANPRNLTTFDVQPSRWPDGWEKVFDGCEGEEDHARMKDFLEHHPDRMVFYYGTHHDKYAFRLDAETESSMAANIDQDDGRGTAYHFYLGEDQLAYNRLMAMVETNRSTLRDKVDGSEARLD